MSFMKNIINKTKFQTNEKSVYQEFDHDISVCVHVAKLCFHSEQEHVSTVYQYHSLQCHGSNHQ